MSSSATSSDRRRSSLSNDVVVVAPIGVDVRVDTEVEEVALDRTEGAGTELAVILEETDPSETHQHAEDKQ